MLDLEKWTAAYRSAGALNELFPQAAFVDSHTLLTKQNAVGVAFELDGFDAETLTEERLESQLSRVRIAFQGLDENYRIYQYLIKIGGAQIEITDGYENEVARRTVERRAEWLSNRKPSLYSVRIVYVVLYEPDGLTALAGMISTRRVLRVMMDDLYRRCGILSGRVATMVEQLRELLGLRLMDKTEKFQFFCFLGCLDPVLARQKRLRHDGNLDVQIATVPIQQVYPNFNVFRTLELQSAFADRIRVGDQDVEVMSMFDWPRETEPNILGRLLKLDCNLVLCSEFKRLSDEKGKEVLRVKQRHAIGMQFLSDFKSFLQLVMARGNKSAVLADTSVFSDVEAIDDVIKRMRKDGGYVGDFSFTAVLFGMPAADLRLAAAQVTKTMGEIDAPMYRESYNALPAFLAIQPGNTAWNFRLNPIASDNYADMSFLCMPDQGSVSGGGHEYLIALETHDRTPHYLQMYSGSNGQRWGNLVMGEPGSGKSFFMNACIDHSQKYNPFTFVLDIGGSYRKLAKKYGASYVDLELGANQNFRINPFSLPPSDGNINFLASFICLLLGDVDLDAMQREEIHGRVRAMYRVNGRSRKLSKFVENLPLELGAYLAPWVGKGQFASVFDNAEDTLTTAEFQVFDFKGLATKDYEPVIGPMFFYVNQRILQITYDHATLARPKLLWADEVWQFVSNDMGRQLLLEAGLTWRKHNGGITLATQSTESLTDAGVLGIVNEICPMKFLLPSPDADLEKYGKIFKLSTKELEKFTELTPQRDLLLKTAKRSKVLIFRPDPEAYGEYANEISLLKGETKKNERHFARAI